MFAQNGIIYFIVFLFIIKSVQSAEGMPQFASESFTSQLFWLLITFSSLYFFISIIILPRIRANIRLRKNKISNDLERAANITSQSEIMFEDYNKSFLN